MGWNEISYPGPGASPISQQQADDVTSVVVVYRAFVEQHYVALKKSNPDFPILIRECSGVQARVWARYGESAESRPLTASLYQRPEVKVNKQTSLCVTLQLKSETWCHSFNWGKESSVMVDNMSADQVVKAVETLVQSKP
ncbi:hypothetical protein L3Q82_022643 [Scortum barcoo]|uniref:Uncharacterized protein n=1 Tax=Scortum barcoo TaxID=214431 RepID=A0ACB8X279_9TELE|nr:hypothetical protein L3Q82_022643 [Scortum barcoo]